jgi:membrane-bound serine protease (ClpP class)
MTKPHRYARSTGQHFSRRGFSLTSLSALLAILIAGIIIQLPGESFAGELYVVTIDGSINPASADYLIGAIEQAEEADACAILIELDTPGGLVSSTQDIIQAMLNSRVPTIVFVTPRGATATSAGTFITLAANVAAMMPGTSIGAAHPVSLFGGGSPPATPPGTEGEAAPAAEQDVVGQKMENFLAAYVESIAKQRHRNVEWAQDAVRNSVAVTAEEALELNVIDLVADSRAALLVAIEGRVVEVEGQDLTLALAGEDEIVIEKTLLQAIFDFLSDPNVATILFAIGALGLYMEFQSPGLIVPGVIGVGAMILVGFALQILPFSWVGALVLLLGVGLLIAELFVASFGLLFAAGLTCFLIGGTMVFDRPEVSDLTVDFWQVLFPIAVSMSLFGALIAYSLGRTLFANQTTGVDEMVGLVGRCESVIQPHAGKEDSPSSPTSSRGKGKVFVRGEYWNCTADESIAEGEAVEIVGIHGLTLRVRKATGGA